MLAHKDIVLDQKTTLRLTSAEDIPIIFRKNPRSKRQNMVVRRGTVEVSFPAGHSVKSACHWVNENLTWIENIWHKTQRRMQQAAKAIRMDLRDKGVISILGHETTIHLVSNDLNPTHVFHENHQLYVHLPSQAKTSEALIARRIAPWAKKRLKEHLEALCKYYEIRSKKKCSRITVRKQSSRWGSCSSKGTISMNQALILAPDYVVEYVLVHELCHLTHMDHSPEFWGLVESFMPDYKQAKTWLKHYGDALLYMSEVLFEQEDK